MVDDGKGPLYCFSGFPFLGMNISKHCNTQYCSTAIHSTEAMQYTVYNTAALQYTVMQYNSTLVQEHYDTVALKYKIIAVQQHWNTAEQHNSTVQYIIQFLNLIF